MALLFSLSRLANASATTVSYTEHSSTCKQTGSDYARRDLHKWRSELTVLMWTSGKDRNGGLFHLKSTSKKKRFICFFSFTRCDAMQNVKFFHGMCNPFEVDLCVDYIFRVEIRNFPSAHFAPIVRRLGLLGLMLFVNVCVFRFKSVRFPTKFNDFCDLDPTASNNNK